MTNVQDEHTTPDNGSPQYDLLSVMLTGEDAHSLYGRSSALKASTGDSEVLPIIGM